jgi:hypothetical protein
MRLTGPLKGYEFAASGFEPPLSVLVRRGIPRKHAISSRRASGRKCSIPALPRASQLGGQIDPSARLRWPAVSTMSPPLGTTEDDPRYGDE